MNERIDHKSCKIGYTDAIAVFEKGIRENSFERAKQRIGYLVQKPLETAVVMSTCQIENDLQTD